MNNRSGRAGRVLCLTLLVLVVGFAVLVRSTYQSSPPGREITFDGLYRLADNGQIVKARLLDEDHQVVGEACDVPVTPTDDGTAPRCSHRAAAFHAPYPKSDVSTQALIERIAVSAEVTVNQQSGKGVAKLIVTFLFPLLILVNLFGIIFVSRSSDTGLADIAGFGRIAARRKKERETKLSGVTFADVAGAGVAVAELREVTDYLANPGRFESYGAVAPKGVLLFGPPGCGKTLLARAVAGESGVPFVSISGTEFVESLVGVGAARVRDLFAQVRQLAPAIVFIDEIDAVGRRREGEGVSGGEREQTLNQLLVEMDGFDVSSGVVVMGATNRPDILDAALLRPGRFDRHVTLDPPDVEGRQAILALHARSKPLGPDVNIETLARTTPGFTGADLANVLNEAALMAVRQGDGARISAANLSEAVQRVLHGPQRRGRIMNVEERRRIAFHEAGHALAAAALGNRDQVSRISIVARGRGLGQSMIAHQDDRVLLTVTEMRSLLIIAMAGTAAEELVFAESSTTSEHDISRATRLAREMVGRYGMSPALGPLAIYSGQNGYTGADAGMGPMSAETMGAFDREATSLIETGMADAGELLSRHRQHLDAIAETLEEVETLEGERLEAALAPVRPEINPFATPAPRRPRRSRA